MHNIFKDKALGIKMYCKGSIIYPEIKKYIEEYFTVKLEQFHCRPLINRIQQCITQRKLENLY